MKIEPTGYWTFFCTPERWNIDKFMSSSDKITRYRIQKNQKDYFETKQFGVISVLDDKRKDEAPWFRKKQKLERGIYAIVEVISERAEIGKSTFDEGYSYKEDNDFVNKYSVKVLFRKDLQFSPLLTKNLKSDPLIYNQPLLLKGKQGISASVLPEAVFDRILSISGIAKEKL